MGLWDKLLGKDSKEETDAKSENLPTENTTQSKVRDEIISNSLDLGWYWSETKDESQIAKIADKDRATHMYVVGATGTGKTKFLEFLIQQDIGKRNGFGVIDPHGDLIEDIKCSLLLYKEEEEISEQVVLIDPTDPNYTVTFNPLEKLPNVSMPEQASELVGAFRKIWSDSWGVRMEDLMRNSLIALGEGGLTLLELPEFLTRRAFRRSIVEKTSHPVVKEYFHRFDSLTDRGQVTWVEPVMNKVNALLSDKRIRDIFSAPKSSFNLREIMDEKKILLIKLDKGKLKDSADLLGSLLMAKIQLAAFSRTDVPQNQRTPFYLYIDEFQNFASESFAVILSEARKYGLSLIMAHQTLSQISEELRSLILGNSGIQVYFRVNRKDANILAKEAFEYSGYEVKSMSLRGGPRYWTLAEEWEHRVEELQTLPPRFCYVKHKIEGGILPIQTVEIDPAWETLNVEENDYRDIISDLPFGGKYLILRDQLSFEADYRKKLIEELTETKQPKEEKTTLPLPKEPAKPEIKEKVPRKESDMTPEEMVFLDFISKNPNIFVTKLYKALKLSGYKGDRLKEGLIEKGLIVQVETREGRGGRLAKILSLTDKGTSILQKSSLAGKGGDLHRYLQLTLKEQAELFGFKATIEEKIPRSLETVDVGLKQDDLHVAIEISSTTKPDQEMQNIRKCLEAGYDYVISVSSDGKNLSSLKTEARKSFTYKERERIKFAVSDQVLKIFKSIVSEKGIVSGQISKEKQLLNTTEASEFLGISKNTLYEWIIQRKIPHVKVGRLVKFRKEDLEGWLKKRTQEEDKREFI